MRTGIIGRDIFAIEEDVKLLIAAEALGHRSILSHADQTGMGISLVAVPEAAAQISECIGHDLDGRRGVRREDQIEMLGISSEELEEPSTDTFHAARRADRGG